jgi:hypothetical protein
MRADSLPYTGLYAALCHTGGLFGQIQNWGAQTHKNIVGHGVQAHLAIGDTLRTIQAKVERPLKDASENVRDAATKLKYHAVAAVDAHLKVPLNLGQNEAWRNQNSNSYSNLLASGRIKNLFK